MLYGLIGNEHNVNEISKIDAVSEGHDISLENCGLQFTIHKEFRSFSHAGCLGVKTKQICI